MATQTLEAAYTAGQTLTGKLFAIGNDTLVATASSVTEATNRKSIYRYVYTDVPAGNYTQITFLSGVAVASENYTLTLTTATFQPWSETDPDYMGGGLTVVPLTGIVRDRVKGTNIDVFFQEQGSIAIGVVDEDNVAVDVSGLTLEIVIEKKSRVIVATIADGSITKVTSTITFTVPLAASAFVGDYTWSLRNTANDVVLLKGDWIVSYATKSA